MDGSKSTSEGDEPESVALLYFGVVVMEIGAVVLFVKKWWRFWL